MKNIKFIPSPYLKDTKDEIIKPVPAKNLIPDWYKKSETSFKYKDGNEEGLGLKTCIPFLDTMLSGYFILLQNNVYVKNTDEGILVEWDGDRRMLSERPLEQGKLMPKDSYHMNNHMAFYGMWGIKVPRRYSVLMTHPLNRGDLPFTTASGIVDSDKMIAWGNIPFFLKKDFEGVIKRGTPICQVIPFKRDTWAMSVDNSWISSAAEQGKKCRSVKRGFYRDNLWSKKRYL